MRQLRLTQGKDMERIERAWLITDDDPLAPAVIEDYRGTWFIRATASDLLSDCPRRARPPDTFMSSIRWETSFCATRARPSRAG